MKQKTTIRLKRTMLIAISIIGILIIAVTIFLNLPRFGKTPSDGRMERVKSSANYRDGKFQNQSYTIQLTGDKNIFLTGLDFLFGKKERLTPSVALPAIKTSLLDLNINSDILVWFGHSSYFMQIDGKRILVDPVFSDASPVSFINKPFKGTDIYKSADMPDIDYLFISHDHWDHLDYNTVMELKNRTDKIICALGVGEHFEHWGFDKDRIIELDWNESASLNEGFSLYCLPARHFSGRGLSPNQSLWASFLLQAPTMNIYIGGDSGYDAHFAKIGEQFGEIDLAILENGQYNQDWKYIHMMPEEVIQAAKDLRAKALLPVHSSKFALGYHPWDEPLKRITEANRNENIRLQTPMIGEIVNIKDTT